MVLNLNFITGDIFDHKSNNNKKKKQDVYIIPLSSHYRKRLVSNTRSVKRFARVTSTTDIRSNMSVRGRSRRCFTDEKPGENPDTHQAVTTFRESLVSTVFWTCPVLIWPDKPVLWGVRDHGPDTGFSISPTSLVSEVAYDGIWDGLRFGCSALYLGPRPGIHGRVEDGTTFGTRWLNSDWGF